MPGAGGGRRRLGAGVGAVLSLALLVAGCTRQAAGPETPSPPGTITSVVGTSTVTSTATTTLRTLTVPGTFTTVTASAPAASTAGPPPSTSEPAPVPGSCPYLADAAVMDANGQHTGQTSIIDVKPYPVCIFTRSDGGYLATTRIVVATTPAQAAAAVNQHVPVAKSNPARYPKGWSGGAMATPDGVPGYPGANSIYAVSKGTIAIIALSNQAQSIKGRQMVEQIVQNLGL
ncbi:MAG TPA: DUF2020 domain-containing protein [Nakamurella sp.]|nr:DUF2020 domain-containing protein [Nakamurella sp.]